MRGVSHRFCRNKATNQNARSFACDIGFDKVHNPNLPFCLILWPSKFPRNAIGHRLVVGVRENLAKGALTKTIESSPWFKCMTWYHAAQSTTPCNTLIRITSAYFSAFPVRSVEVPLFQTSLSGVIRVKKECYGVFAILLYHLLQIIDSWRANNLKNSHSANRSKHIKRRRDLPNRTQGCANNLLCHNTLQAFSWNLQFSTNEVVICLCTHSWT